MAQKRKNDNYYQEDYQELVSSSIIFTEINKNGGPPVNQNPQTIALKHTTNNTNEQDDQSSQIQFLDHSSATLAKIQGSHDGTSDDTKGNLILSTHIE